MGIAPAQTNPSQKQFNPSSIQNRKDLRYDTLPEKRSTYLNNKNAIIKVTITLKVCAIRNA